LVSQLSGITPTVDELSVTHAVEACCQASPPTGLLGLSGNVKFVISYDPYRQAMLHYRFPDGSRKENTVNRNISDYIRIVVLDINLEGVELEMLNL
jgi:hypothetical protein